MYYLCVHVELEMLIFANSDGFFFQVSLWVHGVTEQRHQNQPQICLVDLDQDLVSSLDKLLNLSQVHWRDQDINNYLTSTMKIKCDNVQCSSSIKLVISPNKICIYTLAVVKLISPKFMKLQNIQEGKYSWGLS